MTGDNDNHMIYQIQNQKIYFRFYNPGSPSVCIYFRCTGSLAHVLSFQGGLSINQILPGLDNFTIVSHSFYSDTDTSFTTCLSVYRLQHQQKDPGRCSDLDVSTELKYTKVKKSLSKFSLSKCKKKFIATDSSEAQRIMIFDLQSGLEESILVATPPSFPLESWLKQDFGFVSEKVIFALWHNKNGLQQSLDLFDTKERSLVTRIDLTKCSMDMRTGLASNGWQLLALNRQEGGPAPEVTTIDTSGVVGLLRIGDWARSDCVDMQADPSAIVGYVRSQGLVVWDFV